ncbi:hypothetical protein PG999_000302 [Apiospora kogelbergensis]|uniref:Uncharacterized protein n=1 Tax=Apiospora kogelbergensis TaxID=1337665 RepID=A0AAW0RBH7_9PEZI
MVFRKSDVQWAGNPRGWQMILSYSFRTRVTSGFFKGTENAKLGEILTQLKGCGSPDLGAGNDEKQKDIRRGIRDLDMVLTGNYRNVTAAAGHITLGDLTLEKISQKIAGYQSEVNWKRPQAWKSALVKIQDAARWVWDNMDDKNALPPALGRLHQSLLDRLLFYSVKLDGLENYAHVSLARLDNLRHVTNGLISKVESRLNAEISIQQHLLANASKRDSASMKTLTILGAVFLPGTFLSSMFSMPFFEFHGMPHSLSEVYPQSMIPNSSWTDMNGPISNSLWIYFVLTIPLTVLVVWIWWGVDKRMVHRLGTSIGGSEEDYEGAEEHLNRLEGQILEKIRVRTGAKLTWTVTPSRRELSRPTRPGGGQDEGEGDGQADVAAAPGPRLRRASAFMARISQVIVSKICGVRSRQQDVELRGTFAA